MTKYDAEIRAIIAENQSVDVAAQQHAWHLRRTGPAAVTRRAQARFDRLLGESEGFRRMGKSEHARALKELEAEEAATATKAAGVQKKVLYQKVREHEPRLRQLLDRITADPELTIPDALDGLGPRDMLEFHSLKELRRQRLETAKPDVLLRTLRTAARGEEAAALIDLILVEEIVGAGGGLATTEDQRGPAKELREMIAGLREMRIPSELIGLEATIEHAKTTLANADVLRVAAIDADHPGHVDAKAAYEREQGAFAAGAGE